MIQKIAALVFTAGSGRSLAGVVKHLLPFKVTFDTHLPAGEDLCTSASTH